MLTAKQWQERIDRNRTFEVLEGKVSARKRRLFACACARQVAGHLDYWHHAVNLGERLADGAADDEESQACERAIEAAKQVALADLDFETAADIVDLRHYVFHSPDVRAVANEMGWSLASRLVHEIFGHLFHSATLDAECLRWRNGIVVEIARTIYEGRRFEEMPILADALLDAGCEDEAILAHCRREEGHVRGCWVLDLVLGKG